MATGGGTPCFFDNLEWMQMHGHTVFLEVDEMELFRRLQSQKQDRPMIARLGDAALWTRIRSHLAERSAFYLKADIVWDATRREIQPLVKMIEELSKKG
jgi:shikimate kinase